ncbi:unnamed protein product [Paramecium sonneborni]|uniref:Uncharacterized protein n=1 Tax=Paramecium sonneborni TaxID=65129 RepID=A0A8S1R5S1_9CILI|nr:unnamed protein product [Paramecium sonneborni]
MQSLYDINGTVIMYGQTGLGKRFAILSNRNQDYLVIRQGDFQIVILKSLNTVDSIEFILYKEEEQCKYSEVFQKDLLFSLFIINISEDAVPFLLENISEYYLLVQYTKSNQKKMIGVQNFDFELMWRI